MSESRHQRKWLYMFLVLTAVIAVPLPLFLVGCGSSGGGGGGGPAYTVMVTPEKVNGWVTNGYTKEVTGYDKLVILSVDSTANYDAGHVPGAYQLDTSADLSATRNNGVSDTISQVATKAQMDDLIQRTGIDNSTVVLFTGGGTNMMSIGRAYFNFRYWGFPKTRLRVMNGTSATYEAAGFTLETTTPTAPTPSTYSVCELTPDTSVRASLEEMIEVAEDADATTIPIDARSANEFNGVVNSTKVTSGTPTFVAFEGRIKTAVHQEWTNLVVSGGNGELLSKSQLKAVMAINGVTSADTTYSYCRTSWRAAVNFLAYDAVLGWDAKIYDGAWIEWGQMAGNETEIDGSLEPDSPWLTNTTARSEAITYNKIDGTGTIEPVAGADSYAEYANAINREDHSACTLISPATLNEWITSGYETDPYGYDSLVVLSVDSSSNYDAGHVPGSYLLNTSTDLSATRFNGVSNTISQVATKAQMDDLIQRTGIDNTTVVVFTGGGTNMMSIGRAYFNFRYWGFPKSRLRVMNGTSSTYEAAGYALQTSTPTAPASSIYNVCDLSRYTYVRASLEEMMDVADGTITALPIDARSLDEYNGVAGSTKVTSATPTYVAFEGRVNGAVHQEWTNLLVSGGNGELLTESELLDVMAVNGVTSSDTTYSYCRTSWRAAVNFLAYDAVLGWDAKIYDGAWIEWGQMAGTEAIYNGSLDPASPWLTNSATFTEALTYNQPAGFQVEPLAYANSVAANANEINTTDENICP